MTGGRVRVQQLISGVLVIAACGGSEPSGPSLPGLVQPLAQADVSPWRQQVWFTARPGETIERLSLTSGSDAKPVVTLVARDGSRRALTLIGPDESAPAQVTVRPDAAPRRTASTPDGGMRATVDMGELVSITVTDSGNGAASLSDTETLQIVVGQTNAAPILQPVGNQTIDELEMLSLVLRATDADGHSLTYSAKNLPAGAAFDPVHGTLHWTPGLLEAGVYEGIVLAVSVRVAGSADVCGGCVTSVHDVRDRCRRRPNHLASCQRAPVGRVAECSKWAIRLVARIRTGRQLCDHV